VRGGAGVVVALEGTAAGEAGAVLRAGEAEGLGRR
jgi:hypothetical protein